MTNAEHFKRLRELYTLFEASEFYGKGHYGKLINLEIENIKLDGKLEEKFPELNAHVGKSFQPNQK